MIRGASVRVTDQLLAELGDPGLEQLSGMLGTDPGAARDAIAAATGVIIGGMSRNAEHPDGAEALRTALDEHADADPFNADVATLARDGQNILAHVLGGQGAEQAAYGLARMAGLDPGAFARLMALLAPMVMALIATPAAEQDLSTAEVAAELHRERAALPGELADLLADVFGDLPEPHATGGARSLEW